MRYLALDLGDRRIGIAVSDHVGMLARPLEVFERTSRVADFDHVADLIAAHHVEALVVGLPLNMDGSEELADCLGARLHRSAGCHAH